MWGIDDSLAKFVMGVLLVIVLGNVALGIFAVWFSSTLAVVIFVIYALVMFNDEWRGFFKVMIISYIFGVVIGIIIF